MKLTLYITQEEAATLRAREIRFGVTMSDILHAFVADFTASEQSNGSDERHMAFEYVQRTFGDRIEYRTGEPITDRELRKIDHYIAAADRAARRQRERRAAKLAKQKATQPRA